MTFANTEQIREQFIKDGWSENISFVELSLEEAKEKGYLFAINGIVKGEKYFKMNGNGNLYNCKGKLLCFTRLM